MDKIRKEKEAIGERVQNLRKLLSLSQGQLGKATGISKGTINSIESGHGFTGDYILAISHFFGMELNELVNYTLPLPDELDFRQRIKKYHQKSKSSAYKVIDEPPNLNALIEFRLAKTNFLIIKPRSVKEIIQFCSNEYDLTLQSSIVSQALKNAVEANILKRVLKDNRNYLYQTSKVKKG